MPKGDAGMHERSGLNQHQLGCALQIRVRKSKIRANVKDGLNRGGLDYLKTLSKI